MSMINRPLRHFSARKSNRSRLFEQLEERVLFDAVPDMTGEMPGLAADDAFVPSVDALAEHSVNSATAAEQSPEQTPREIVFVDKSVAGYEALVADLVITNHADVIFLDASTDGLSQMAERLQGRTGISAVHIISHGDKAELSLGTATLTAESITGQHADELAIISGALTDDADLLIYGCSFGEGEAGRAAAQSLADVTRADVAASDDLTGNHMLGGDWDLELRTGEVETSVLQAVSFAGVLSVEATESVVTIQDAEASGAGTVSLSQNGAPLAVTTSGTPARVGQMLERVWQYDETEDVGEATYVFDVSSITNINGTIASDFGLIISDTANLSGTNTTTLVASGYDSTNKLIFFHGVDLSPNDYFGLATEVVADNFSVSPTASGLEDTAIDLGLTLNPALTDGGTLRDVFATTIGYRASNAGTTATEFLIPAGTTGIKITSYSTRDIGTSASDSRNDDYQSLNVNIDLKQETSSGFIAHLIDQGPARSDQFGWSDAPLGTAVLSGGGTITGDANDNINPTFSIVDGKLQIVENHALQTAYHVEFLTNATSSADFLGTLSAVRESNEQNSITLAIPAEADFIVLNIADAATATSDAHVENKGNSRIVIDLATLRASGTVAAERGESDGRVIAYAFEDYDVSSSTVGSVLDSDATVVGDTQETHGLLNDSQIYVSGGNLVIDRNDTFATNFNSLVTAEFYERKNVGSSAELLGESTDYQFWNTSTANPTPVSKLTFDIPDNATLGILNLSLNGTYTNNTNENMGAGFAVIDLTTGRSSGTWYMVRASRIVDFVAWNDTEFDEVFFQDPNSISNHDNINQFNDRHAGNAEFVINAAGDELVLQSTSNRGNQSYLDYYAGAQVQWYGTAPFELTGFPVGGTFNSGSLNASTGNWDLTIEEALADGLFFLPDEHVSGTQPIDVSIRIGNEVDTSAVRVEAVIDPIHIDASDACGNEDTDISISANVAPAFVDQDGSETVTGVRLDEITIGHTVSDGVNSFTATAGNQSLDITGWNRSALTYRALPDQTGTFTVEVEVDWQDVGGGVTDTGTMADTFDIVVKPVNDSPVAVNDSYLTFSNTQLTTTLGDGVLSNDSDPDGHSLTVNTTPVSGPSSGSVTLNSDGTFTYTPNNGFIGTDSFVYQISDGAGGTAQAVAQIQVSPLVTGLLEAKDDSGTTPEETTINIAVMANDDLPTSGSFTITSTSNPSNGTVSVLSDGTIDYTPDADWFGVDSFTYTLTDASGRTSTATVEVTVTNTQDPPTATADSGSTPEDTTLTSIPILRNDSDPDGDTLAVTTVSVLNGTVNINGDGTIDYTPNLNFTGTDTVTYTISDGNGGSATSTVLINVVPVADPPASADNDVTVAEDSEYVFAAGDFAFADGDPGDVLTTIRIDTVPTGGQLTFAGNPVVAGQVVSLGDINSGRLAFRPDPNDFGNNYATFNFSVSDGAQFQVAPNTMTVHVTPESDPPVATENAITVAEGSSNTPLGLSTPTDSDGDVLTATITSLPTIGHVTLADGTPVSNGDTLTMAELTSLQYDAPSNYSGGDPGDFTYDVSDGSRTDTGVVYITITAVNDRPTVDLNGTNDDCGLHVNDAAAFAAALTGNAASTITDTGGAFAPDPVVGTVSQVVRSGAIGADAYSYTIYDVDVSNTLSGTITPGSVGGDIADLDTIAVEAPATQGSATGTGSWGVDSLAGQNSTRNGLLFDFTTTPGGAGIGHFGVDLHDMEGDTAFTAAEFRIYKSGVLVDSGELAWGNNGNNQSNFFCYVVGDPSDYFDQVLIIVGDDGTGGGFGERLAADRMTFGAAYSTDSCFFDHTGTFTEGGPGVAIADPVTDIADVDDVTLPLLTIDVDESRIVDVSTEFLTIGGTDFQLDDATDGTTAVTVGSISYEIAFTASTAVFEITRSDSSEMTPAEMEAILTSTTYRNTSPLPTVGDRIFRVTASDGDDISNTATGTISVVRDATFVEWSITGSTDVIDGNAATYTVALSSDLLQPGETATVDIAVTNIDTNSSDYSNFSSAVATAVAAYSGPGLLTWVGSTLTFTSDGAGAMTPLVISLTTTPDGVYEGDEDLEVSLSNPGATTGETVTVGPGDEVTTTIEDNDSPITVSISDGSATEGSPVGFTISMDYTSFEDIVLNLAVSSGSATATTDFETTNFEYFDGTSWVAATNGTEVTIPAGDTSLLVRVDSSAEGIVEADETFTLSATVLSGSVNDASDTGTGTIVNDDVPAISIDDVTIDEDNGTMTFTVSLDQAPVNAPATVDWATSNGTATAADFTAASGSLSFAIGETSKTIVIAITNDSLFEQSETLNVNLSNAGVATIAEAQGIGTITDDGTGPNGTDDDRPTLAVNDVTATEDVDTHAEFEVTLSNPSTQPTVVSLALNDVSATSGSDYGPGLEYYDGANWVALAGNLTIPADTTTVRVRTPVLDDAVIDNGETFTLVATTVSGITTNASDTGVGTILDDPTPDDTTVAVSGPPGVTEGASAIYTVSIDNTPLTDVTVTFSYSGTASGGSDYAGVASVTIPAGSTNAMFTINTINDLLGEPLENVIVSIDSISGGSLENTVISATNSSVTTSIIDDDVPTISVTDVTVTEGEVTHAGDTVSNSNAEFTVNLSNATFEDIHISLAAIASGTDPATSEDSGTTPFDFGTIGADDLEVFDGTSWVTLTATTISAGDTSLRLRTAINDDAFLEGAESFTVTATVISGTTTNSSADGTGTILDDPTDPEVVLISLTGPASVVEGSNTTNYTLALTEIAAEDVVITLGYSGPATDGSDYGSVATVTIPSGTSSATFTLPTVDDAIHEGGEDVVITIDSVTGGGFESLSIDPAANTVTTTITDAADTPTVSVNSVTVVEGTDDYAIYTIEITNLSVEDIDFDLTLVPGTAVGGGTDFDSVAGGLEVFDGTNWNAATSATIAAGGMSVQVRVPIVDDTIDEPSENYALKVDVTAGTTTNIQVIGTGTIIDDDAAPDVTIADATASEGDGLEFDVTLSNPSSLPIVLSFTATNQSATAAADYFSSPFEYSTDGGTVWLPAVNGSEVTIPAEQTAIKVRIATTEDTALETSETLQLAIGSVVSGTAGNTSDSAVGTITDDDSAVVSITASDSTAGEPADSGQFTVSMTNPADSPTVVSYTITGTAANGTDYTTISGSITLPAGSVSGQIDLDVIDDTIVEGSEDVTLTLTAITSGDADITIHPTDNSATATIADDDEASWRLIGDDSVNEGAIATYRLDLIGTLAAGEAVSVDLNHTQNSTSPADHVAIASALTSAVAAYSGSGSVSLVGTTLTFTSDGTGSMSQLVIEVLATNDTIVEGPEEYTVALSGPASTTGAAVVLDAASSVTTTINDTFDAAGTSDDTAEWSITGPSSAGEATSAAYTIALNAPLGQNETAAVDIALVDIDTNFSDYTNFTAAVTAAADANADVTFDGISKLTFTAPTDGASMSDLVINLGMIADSSIEGQEDFKLIISNPTSTTAATIAVDATQAEVTTTITDLDGPADWRLTGDTSVNEAATATYNLDLLGTLQSGESVSIDLALSESTTNSADHDTLVAAVGAAVGAYSGPGSVSLSGTTVTFTSDGLGPMNTLTFSISAINDGFVEGSEDYTVTIANAQTTTGASVSVNAANTVTTVINDTTDSAGTAHDTAQWAITGTTATDEGTTASYTIELDTPLGLGETATVDLSLADIDTNSTDYAAFITAVTNAAVASADVTFDGIDTLTFTAPTDGALLAPFVIELGITDDSEMEGSEDFRIVLSNPGSTTGATIAVDGTKSDVVTTINDTQGPGGAADGPAEWGITGQTWSDEGGTYPWTISLSGTFGIGQSASVVVSATDISTNPADYADIHAAINAAIAGDSTLAYDSNTGTLTYTAPSDGSTMSDLTFNFGITDDPWSEGPESFSIGLSSAGSATGLTTVGIDSSSQSVTIEINDTIGEGGDPDAGIWSITGDTSIDEGDIATYTISLEGQIGRDESVQVKLLLDSVDTNSRDYAGFVTAVQDAIAGDSTLSFNPADDILTFTSPSDGTTMSDITLTLPITDDSFTEGPEDYRVRLADASSATGAASIFDTDENSVAINDFVTTTIDDTQGIDGSADAPAIWRLTGASSVTEGASATYTLTLNGHLGINETAAIDVSLANVDTTSADYASLIKALTLAASTNPNITFDGTGKLTYTAPADNASMAPLTINLFAQDDSLIEGVEDYKLQISNPESTTGANVGIDTNNDEVETTIIDNDNGEWSISGDARVNEGSGASYTISLSGTYGAGESTSILAGLTDNTTVGGDHSALLASVQAAIMASGRTDVALAGNVLTFTSAADNSTMPDLTFTIAATQDSTLEPDEDYDVTLATPSTTSGISVTLTTDSVNTVINDNADTAEVTIEATTDGSETGSADGRFTVTMTSPSSTDTVINYTVAGTSNAGDHDLADSTVTIAAGQTSATITVPVTDDSLIEGTETVVITLTSIASGDAQITIGSANNDSIDIADNDRGQWSITGDAAVNEGSDASYTIALSGAYGSGENASITLGLNDNTTSAADHMALLASVQAAITAGSRTDLALAGNVLTFTGASDNTTMDDLVFAVTATEDPILEASEDYDVTLATPSTTTGISVSLGNATVNTIINDDADTAEVTIEASIHGNETGPVNGLFTVFMTNPASVDTVINYAVEGNANAGDHTLANGTVTIPAGQTSATITVPVIDNGLVEDMENVSVTLTSITSADPQVSIGATDSASIDITDNDAGQWSIAGPSTVNEGSHASYRIRLSGNYGANETTSITLGLTDHSTSTADHDSLLAEVHAAITASGRTDIVLIGNLLTFTSPADNSTFDDLVFDITAVQDSTVEANEDYDVTLTAPATTSGISVTLGNASINTIINDDADTAEVTIAATTQADETGPVDGLFTVSITSPSSTDTVVAYTVGGSSDNSDHGLVNGTVTIRAGETTARIDVPVIDDSLIEGTETVSVQLTSITFGDPEISIGSADAAIIHITDNDSGQWALTGPSQVDEGGTASYTISLAGTLQAGETATIDLAFANVDTSDADYADFTTAVQNAVTSRPDLAFDSSTSTLTFTSQADGVAMVDLVVTLTATDDAFVEGPERFTVSLLNPGSTSGIVTGLNSAKNIVVTTISDTQSAGGTIDGPTEWSLAGAATVGEGATAAYDVRLTGNLQADETTSVQLTITDLDTSPADYDSFNTAVADAVEVYNGGAHPGSLAWNGSRLTFTSDGNGPMGTLTVALNTIEDSLAEGPERYRLNIANASSTTGISPVIAPTGNSVTTTITDDDTVKWSLVGNASVDEGATASYTIALDGTPQSGEQVSVKVGLADSGTSNSDYASFLNAVSSAAASRSDISFETATGILTFTGTGSSMVDFAVDLGATNDNIIEGPEDFVVSLSSPTSATGTVVVVDAEDGSVTTRIKDTQGADGATEGPGEWNISGPASGNEGTDAVYTVSLTGTYGSGEVLTVNIDLANVTTSASDYGNVLTSIEDAADANPDVSFDSITGTLTYTSPADGASMADLIISLRLTNDSFIEGPEDFQLGLSTAASSTGANTGIGNASVVTTIDDTQGANGATEGPAEWSITGPASIDEGTTPQYTVALSGQFGAGEVVTVDLKFSDVTTNDSDYASVEAAIAAAAAANSDVTYDASTGTLSYTAAADGATMAPLLINLAVTDDIFIEGREVFKLEISNAATTTEANVAIDPASASIVTTINDTQGPNGSVDGPATWSLTGPPEVAEGTIADYTISLSGVFQAGEAVSADFRLTDDLSSSGDHANFFNEVAAAAAGRPDLAFDPATGTLTYTAPADGASMTPLVVGLPIADDAIVEGSESFTIHLCNAKSATGAAAAILGTQTSSATAPVAIVDHVLTLASQTISFDPTANDFDADGDMLSVAGVTAASNGALTQNGNTLTSTPDSGFIGQDTFQYTIADGAGHTTTGTVILTVQPVGSPIIVRPFGQHTEYADGTILPNHRTATQLDDDVRAFYDNWKSRYLVPAGTVNGQPLYRIAFDFGSSVTVSEGQGYGMMITALLAGHDPDAQEIFDGLWRFSKQNPSDGDPRLSDWIVPTNVDGNGSAFDGDADIAYGLLLADAQWGSGGNIDYATEAESLIDAIYQSTIGPDSRLPELGDWVQADDPVYDQWVSRSSDHMPSHFRAFGRATGDIAAWNEVIANSQAVIDHLQVNYSPTTGLLPDFIVNADTGGEPAPANFEEGPYDGAYFFNAGRVPWRLGLDALLNGDATSALQVQKISDWAESATGGDPAALQSGYNLDGAPLPGSNYFSTFFASPIGVAAMSDPEQQAWLNSVYDSVYNVEENYYEDSVNLLSLITMSGNFWDPTVAPNTVSGTSNLPPVSPSVVATHDCPAAVTTIINGDPYVQDDIQHTAVGTPASGNVLINDFDPDGDPLTVTPTPVTPPTSGTLVLNSNGSYTYTPNDDFRGVDTFEYEVCDDWGNCETAVVTIAIADLSASKQQTLLVPNGDNFDVTFQVKVENTGSTRMDNLSLFDDVASQFGATFLSISNVSLDTTGVTSGSTPALNADWQNNTSVDILDGTNTNEYLLPGESFILNYTVTMDPDAGGSSTTLTNQAHVTGDDITTLPGLSLRVSDSSDSGSDPSTNNTAAPGDTGGEDDATPLHIPDLRVARQQTGTPTQQSDGSWNVDFELFVENTGTVDLSSPSLFDDVGSQFSTAWHGSSNLSLDSSGVSAGTAPGLNDGWLTDPSASIFDGTGVLKPGEFVRITFTVNIDPDDLPTGLSRGMTSQATGGGSAVDSSGQPMTDGSGNPITVSDLSDAGSDPNGLNPNQHGDSGQSDDPNPLVLPEIGIAKRIIGSVPSATPGNFNVTYEAVIRNTGSVNLGNLTLVEDLENQIGGGFQQVVGNPTIYASTATSDPVFNSNWNGNLDNTGDANMFDGVSGLLQPGEQIVVQFTIEIDVDQITPSSNNQITAGGSYDETPDSDGFQGLVSDLSDTGSNPAGTNAGQTGDSTSADDPTLVPAVGLAKQHGTPVAAGTDGEDFSVPITLTLKNLGPVELGSLHLVDDIRTQFGGSFVSIDSLTIDTSGASPGTIPELNTSWNGDATNILDGTGTLKSGDELIVTFNVVIDPDAGGTASELTNSAIITASDANNPGLVVQDLSDSGASPSTSNPGAPGDNRTADDPTPILIADAGLAKQVTDISRNGNGFDLTLQFTLENTGTATLTDLQLHDDLMDQFGPHFGYVDEVPQIFASNATAIPSINANYVNDTSQNIFEGTGELKPGESITVQLIVHVTPAATGTAELVNQAIGGGTPIAPDGTPIAGGPVIDRSDSGDDPNGTNPGAPGDTGGTADATSTSLQFYSYDSFNNFSAGFGQAGSNAGTEHVILSRQISTLAPEPSFSGSARPGTRIIGRIYNSAGNLVAEEMSLADMGGNWMMVMHSASGTDHHRIEFVEVVGQGDTFGSYGDIYGYLGLDSHFNRYAALEPITAYGERYSLGSVYRNSPERSMEDAHRTNNDPLGFGV